MEDGLGYVIPRGTTRMHLWCADNWDTLLQVRHTVHQYSQREHATSLNLCRKMFYDRTHCLPMRSNHYEKLCISRHKIVKK